MSLTRQAKVLTRSQQAAVLSYLTQTRNPDRNRVIFLLSVKAGLRAKEISALTWSMVTDPEGSVARVISLENRAAKGKHGGGVLPINAELREALGTLQGVCGACLGVHRVVQSERGQGMSAQVVINLFRSWYLALGFEGCSSHSGRRTFITSAARKISSVGGSMRDVQVLARHTSLNMTMRYIQVDAEAMRKVVELI
jgi:integrase/recombinase XerD